MLPRTFNSNLLILIHLYFTSHLVKIPEKLISSLSSILLCCRTQKNEVDKVYNITDATSSSYANFVWHYNGISIRDLLHFIGEFIKDDEVDTVDNVAADAIDGSDVSQSCESFLLNFTL